MIVLLIGCMVSTARILTEAPAPHPDNIAQRSDQRFAALLSALPAQGIVGYIGEPGNLADYYLAQYALAPLVVDRSPDHPLVVGNFPSSSPPLPNNLQLMKDFGNGVLLLAHKDAQ
jgi:hypothetical protein